MTVTQTEAAPATPGGRVSTLTVSGSGAEPITWNPADSEQTNAARDRYNKYRGMGYLGYAVDTTNPTNGEQLTEFDPHAQRIIMTRPLQGG